MGLRQAAASGTARARNFFPAWRGSRGAGYRDGSLHELGVRGRLWRLWRAARHAARRECEQKAMILNAKITPQRMARTFKRWTRLSFQVRGAATLFLSKEQGESQNQTDGIQLTQANTNPPYDVWWLGELWYSASTDNSPLNVLIVGEATPDYRP